MPNHAITIEELWNLKSFKPNPSQREAILHTEGPLFLTAGPGSGKTRVLLWRTLNLLVFHGVKPEEIYLSTFTEKAARQLRDGLRTLLGLVTNLTQQPYDISGMALGTVHSICQKLITDRRFSKDGERTHAPKLLDELSQYFKVFNRSFWSQLCISSGFSDAETAVVEINNFFGNSTAQFGPSLSRHLAVQEVINLFNRFSEESLVPSACKTDDDILNKLITMYKAYLADLDTNPFIKQVDFSLLQKAAFDHISAFTDSGSIFKHIIIDEYQDTNAIQEKIFFTLARGNRNICVVGDDDQALYRFRGAAVENLVDFESRCENATGLRPKRIDLSINYRSRKNIVDTYTSFINVIDWKREAPKKGYYRIHDKNITAHRSGEEPSVLVSSHAGAETVYREIAMFIYDLKVSKKIEDYSQVAFLFPSLKGRVDGFRDAFNAVNEEKRLTGTPDELRIYAPRAGRFLEVDEARAMWGLFLLVFGRPHYEQTQSKGLIEFRNWMFDCIAIADNLCKEDSQLAQYIHDRQAELALISKDYNILAKTAEDNNLKQDSPFKQAMIRTFADAPGLSMKGRKNISSNLFINIIKQKEKGGDPFSIGYIINRSTSLDWSLLDLFYQLCGFAHFRKMFELAQSGVDEGPVCNLGLISQYLSRFMDEYSPVITASFYREDIFIHCFFSSYTYALYRLGESEYEDADDPFPKGRISFLTIHQSKGLEFPVVVMGNLNKQERIDKKETIIRELLDKEGEPLDRIARFDNMRMFYVALSRAKNLLVLPRFTTTKKAGKIPRPDQLYATGEFKTFLTANTFPQLSEFDLGTLPAVQLEKEDLGKSYSYTSDYILYERCPRQYMILRQYGFVPSRSQTMLFGSLVHQTIEDLHWILINERTKDTLL